MNTVLTLLILGLSFCALAQKFLVTESSMIKLFRTPGN